MGVANRERNPHTFASGRMLPGARVQPKFAKLSEHQAQFEIQP